MSFTIDLTPEQERQVRAAAGRVGRSPEALVADLVSRALESERPEAEARDKSAREPEVAELPVEMRPDYRGVFPGWDAPRDPGVYSLPGGGRVIVGPRRIRPDGRHIYDGLYVKPERIAQILSRPPIRAEDLDRLAAGSPEDLPTFQQAISEFRRNADKYMAELDKPWDGENEQLGGQA